MNTSPRFDIYALIHKGMRLGLSQCLLALGSMDDRDDAELQPVMDDVGRLLDLCRAHVKHENEFIHTAMERRQPGSTRTIANEHVEHLADIDSLQQERQRILRLPSLRRAEPATRFYRRFAQFTALNLEHMAHEESDNNAVLWACYSDAELEALDRELVSHVEPAIMQTALGYMVPAMNPAERAKFMAELRQAMPEEVLAELLGTVGPLLTPAHQNKLQQALALPAANAA